MDVKTNLIIFFTSICSLVGIGGLLAFFAARTARKERNAEAENEKAKLELAERAKKQAREELAKKVPISSISGGIDAGEVSLENRAIVDLFVDYKKKEEILKTYVQSMSGSSSISEYLRGNYPLQAPELVVDQSNIPAEKFSWIKHGLADAEIEKHMYGTSWQGFVPRGLANAEIQKNTYVSWDEFVARVTSDALQQKKGE